MQMLALRHSAMQFMHLPSRLCQGQVLQLSSCLSVQLPRPLGVPETSFSSIEEGPQGCFKSSFVADAKQFLKDLKGVVFPSSWNKIYGCNLALGEDLYEESVRDWGTGMGEEFAE